MFIALLRQLMENKLKVKSLLTPIYSLKFQSSNAKTCSHELNNKLYLSNFIFY